MFLLKVVALTDGTVVQITLPLHHAASVIYDGTTYDQMGESFTVTLNQGQVLQVQDDRDFTGITGSDLSG